MIGAWSGIVREVATTIKTSHIQEKDRMDLILQKCLQLRNRSASEAGQTLAEYSVLLVLIAVAVVAAVVLVGSEISGMFTNLAEQFP